MNATSQQLDDDVVGEEGNSYSSSPPPSSPDCLAPSAVCDISREDHKPARRIYPTSFKLQVLDSYRSDGDCRGNQRATARKFGIHRRQIQKWLQVENDLRDSNIANTTSVMIDDEEPIALNLCIKSSNNTLVEEMIDVESAEDLSVFHNEDPQDLSVFHEVQDLSCTRLQDQQTPSPSTSSVSGKRRSFTLQFKLDVLDAFYTHNACKGNQRATARLFGINRRQVQKWLCQEVQLRSEFALSAQNYESTGESSAKRQRLGKWLWTVPHWTMVNWKEEPHAVSIPNLLPPQDTALCLKVEKPPTPPPQPTVEIRVPQTSPLPIIIEESAPKPKRHSYPLDFKLQALDAYHEDMSCRGNQRAVAKRFSIHRRQVQKWLKQEQQLRQRLAAGVKETVRAVRSPAVLKPMQMLSQQSAYSWVEELRAPAPCWS
ncbi:hypothetical protein B566_EDAN010314 [Ephemera danica]|nr:hypothetical protein B566_EDAN010314 [Ephemera danica]